MTSTIKLIDNIQGVEYEFDTILDALKHMKITLNHVLG